MLRNISVILAVSIFFAGCSATQELRQARRDNNERITSYSPLTGDSHRLLPRTAEGEQIRAMPKNTVYSYSPLTGQSTLIEVQPGKKAQASTRKSPNQADQIVSYSPLWGEALVVPRDR